MKATVRYFEGGQKKLIEFDAFDAETIGKAVTQWKYNEKRVKKRDLKDVDICQSCLLGDKSRVHSMIDCPGNWS
jgi:hypothetical protein